MPDTTLKSPLVTALSWAFSANALTGFINLGGQIVFARILGVSVISEYAVIVVSIEFLLLFLSFGFNQAVIRYHDKQNIFTAAAALILFQALGVLLISGVFYFVFQSFDGKDAIPFLPALIYIGARIIGFLTTLSYAPLEGELNYKPIAIAKLISIFAGVGVGFLFAWFNPSIYTLILRDGVGAVLLFLLLHQKCPNKLSLNWRRADLKSVWRFCRPIWMLNILERGALRGDYALAAMALGQHEFGIYFQIRALFEGVLGFVVNPIQTVIYSYFCRQGDRLSLYRKTVRSVFPYYMMLALGVAMVGYWTSLGTILIEFLLGPEWVTGGAILGWLGLYILAILLYEFTKAVAIADHKKKAALAGRVVQVMILIVAVVPLARVFGLSGAALASMLGGVALATISTILLYWKTPRRESRETHSY